MRTDNAVERVLDKAARSGMLGPKEEDGVKNYRNIPLFIGFGEAGSHRGTPGFCSAIAKYLADGPFWQEFLTSAVPQIHTIPIEQPISYENRIKPL